jgi:hypothetical protein
VPAQKDVQLWRKNCATVANDADFRFVFRLFSIFEMVLSGSHVAAVSEEA